MRMLFMEAALTLVIGGAVLCAAAAKAEEQSEIRAQTADYWTEETQAWGEMLPQFWDCRDGGKTPDIRTQGKLGTCWAISACSALEASLLPAQHLVFSPDHLSLNNGFVISQQEGGDSRMIMAYLAGWRGPVLEREDPYGDGATVDGLLPAVHVQEMHLLDGLEAREIKREIVRFGPVQTSLCMDRRMTQAGKGYYNPQTFAFCDRKQEKVTHDILILGWDDTFPAERFVSGVKTDGAWICQNTWGASFGDNGIFYVSYEDANIARTGISYVQVEPAGNYAHIYQHDPLGWQGRLGYNNETAWFANLYQAEEQERLEAVGFYALGRDTEYTIYLSHFAEGEHDLADRKKIACGHLEAEGYFTIPLDVPEPLEAGEPFALIVQVTVRGVKKPVAVEIEKDVFTSSLRLDGKHGYVSAEGILWDEAETVYGANVCLKGYTNPLEPAR